MGYPMHINHLYFMSVHVKLLARVYIKKIQQVVQGIFNGKPQESCMTIQFQNKPEKILDSDWLSKWNTRANYTS